MLLDTLPQCDYTLSSYHSHQTGPTVTHVVVSDKQEKPQTLWLKTMKLSHSTSWNLPRMEIPAQELMELITQELLEFPLKNS